MTKMERKKNKIMKAIVIISMFCLLLLSCSFGQEFTKRDCLEEQLSFILSRDNEAKLHSNEELLLILNFDKTESSDLRVALIPKSVYPEYLIGKIESKLKGYFKYEGVIALTYGNVPDFLNLESFEEEMPFTKPFKMPQPEKGKPPFSPFLIEPLIYSYLAEKNCYSLKRQTIADTLLE